MESDWKELIELLQSHGVEFIVVGAHPGHEDLVYLERRLCKD